MNDENYRKAMEDAQKELEHWLRLRMNIDQRIAQLRSTVALLCGLIGEAPRITPTEGAEEIGDLGISDAIRQVLRDAHQRVTPAEIKVLLIQAQFDLGKYVNSSAVIHNTLKRLEGQGEVDSMTEDPPGITTYSIKRRVSSNPDVPLMNFGQGLAAAMEEAGKNRLPPIPSFGEATSHWITKPKGGGK